MFLSLFESQLSNLGTEFGIPPHELVVERLGTDMVVPLKLLRRKRSSGDPAQELLHFIGWNNVHHVASFVGRESRHFDNSFASCKECVVFPDAHVVAFAKFGTTLSHDDISRFRNTVGPNFDPETSSSIVGIVPGGTTRFLGSHPSYAAADEWQHGGPTRRR